MIVRGIPSTAAKDLIAWQFASTLAGGFLWGSLADQFGRCANYVGFVAASAAIAAYLFLETSLSQLRIGGSSEFFSD